MAKHALEVQPPWYANQRVWRTLLQVGLPSLLAFGLVVPEIITIILDGYGETLPAPARAWLLAAAAFVTATAGVLSKIMALPTVNDWLSRHTPFGTVPTDQVGQ